MKYRKARTVLLILLLGACLLLASCSRQKPDFTALTAGADRVVVKRTGGLREVTLDPKTVEEQLDALTEAATRALDDCKPYGYIDPDLAQKWRATFLENGKEILKIELWLLHPKGWVVTYEINEDTLYFCCDDWDEENDVKRWYPPEGIDALLRALNAICPLEDDWEIDYFLAPD